MVNEKIQNVLSRLEKDIDYENSHRDEIPGEKRLNCISKNIGTFYNIMLKSIHAKNILEIKRGVDYSIDFINELLIEYEFEKVDFETPK